MKRVKNHLEHSEINVVMERTNSNTEQKRDPLILPKQSTKREYKKACDVTGVLFWWKLRSCFNIKDEITFKHQHNLVYVDKTGRHISEKINDHKDEILSHIFLSTPSNMVI